MEHSISATFADKIRTAREHSQFQKVKFEDSVRTDRGYRYMLEMDRYHNLDGGTGGPRPFAAWLSAYSNSCRGIVPQDGASTNDPETTSETNPAPAAENMVAVVDHMKGFHFTVVRFVATRDIEPEEELLWDYAFATHCCEKAEEYEDPVWEAICRLSGAQTSDEKGD